MKNIFVVLIVSFILISCDRENPNDRNYLIFPNGNIDEIIDSLNSFKNMVKSMDLPRNTELNYTSFRYIKNNFEISQKGIGVLNYNNLRNAEFLKHLSNEQINDFFQLYKYLFFHSITPGKYFYEGDWFIFYYKEYYYMYDNLTYDDDLERFLLITESKVYLDLENYKILDSYKNLYLYTFKDSKIRSDDVKYELLPKFRLE